jgi:hypothetical protein
VLHPAPVVLELVGSVEGQPLLPRPKPHAAAGHREAFAGRGLGTATRAGAGTFSPRAAVRPGYDLTLIAAKSSTSSPQPATRSTSPGPAATSSPGRRRQRSGRRTFRIPARSCAKAAGCANRACTWTVSVDPDCCGHSSTAAACASTSSPTARSGSAHPSASHSRRALGMREPSGPARPARPPEPAT